MNNIEHELYMIETELEDMIRWEDEDNYQVGQIESIIRRLRIIREEVEEYDSNIQE